MGQLESAPSSSSAQRQGGLPTDWRYTIQSIVMDSRLIKINESHYKFSRELGTGAFGAVYAARRTTDGMLRK